MFLVLSIASQVATTPPVVTPRPAIVTESRYAAPPPPPMSKPRREQRARAKADLASYLSDSDYPQEAIRRGEEGTTAFRLSIGADGKVTGCTVSASSGSNLLDETTCRLMTSRPSFTPARNRRGRRTIDTINSRIRWQIPKFTILPEAATSQFIIGADGVARDCRASNRHYRLEERILVSPACDELASLARLVSAVKAQSTATETRVRQEMRLLRDTGAPWPDFGNGNSRVVAETRVRLQVEPGGRISRCTVIETKSLIGASPQPCRGMMTVANDGRTSASEMRLVAVMLLEGEGAKP